MGFSGQTTSICGSGWQEKGVCVCVGGGVEGWGGGPTNPMLKFPVKLLSWGMSTNSPAESLCKTVVPGRGQGGGGVYKSYTEVPCDAIVQGGWVGFGGVYKSPC